MILLLMLHWIYIMLAKMLDNTNLITKKMVNENAMRAGMSLIPSFSLPFEISPIMSEPIMHATDIVSRQ